MSVSISKEISNLALGCKIENRFQRGNSADLDRNHAYLHSELVCLYTKVNSTSYRSQRKQHCYSERILFARVCICRSFFRVWEERIRLSINKRVKKVNEF